MKARRSGSLFSFLRGGGEGAVLGNSVTVYKYDV